MLARSVIRSPWHILFCWGLAAVLGLLVPAGAAAQVAQPPAAPSSTPVPKPLVVLEPAPDSQLAVSTTQAQFCLQVAVVEKGGADSGPVVLEALQFLVEGSDESSGPVPHLSVDGCDADGQARLELGALKAQQVRPVFLSGDLARLGTYSALLFLWQGEGPATTYTLKVSRAKPATALALATPEPPRWRTGGGLWNGAGGTLEFDLNVSDPQPARLDPPVVTRLVRVVDGKVVDNLLGRVAATAVLEGELSGAQGHMPLQLVLGGLEPGEYHATVRVTARDGREVEGAATAFVRHHWWLALLVLIFSVALAWLLHSWSSGGRSRALIARRLDCLALSMKDGRDAAGRLPLSVGQQAAVEAWQALEERLEEEHYTAKLEGGAPELKVVHDEVKARVLFLLDGQDLAEEYDHTVTELVSSMQLNSQKGDEVRAQVKRRVETLGDQVTRLEQTALAAAASGAPHTLELMRSRLEELRRYGYQVGLDQAECDLQALARETPRLATLAAEAIENHLAKARKWLAVDDYQEANQWLREAREVHANLRLQQIDLGLAELAGQKPVGIDPQDWQEAQAAMQAVQAEVAKLPSPPSTDDKLTAWRAASPLFTLAQVRALQAALGVTPADLTAGSWKGLRSGHQAGLDDALAGAAAALPSRPEEGRRLASAARAELAWLVRDLAAYRLRRLAYDLDSRPLNIAANDARWLALRAQAQVQFDALPERLTEPHLAEAALIRLRGRALDPLVGRLVLAEGALGGLLPSTKPRNWAGLVAAFRSALHLAQKHLADLHGAALGGDADLRALLERAEGSMAAAWACYEDVEAASAPGAKSLWAWSWQRNGVQATLWAAPAWAEPGELALVTRELTPLRVRASAKVRESLARAVTWWERLIAGMDFLSLAVSFVLALLAGMATQYVGKATFGSWSDYVLVALWGFGVTQVTSASLSGLSLLASLRGRSPEPSDKKG